MKHIFNTFRMHCIWLCAVFAVAATANAQTLTSSTVNPPTSSNLNACLTWGNGDTLIIGGVGYFAYRTTPTGTLTSLPATNNEINGLSSAVTGVGVRRVWSASKNTSTNVGFVTVSTGSIFPGTPLSLNSNTGEQTIRDIVALGDSAYGTGSNSRIYKYKYDGTAPTALTQTTLNMDTSTFGSPFILYESIDAKPDGSVIIAAGENEAYARSADNGVTWSEQKFDAASTSTHKMWSIKYAGGSTWYAAGGTKLPGNVNFLKLYKSTDDGATWTALNSTFPNATSPEDLRIDAMYFSSPTTGYVSGDKAFLTRVYKTTDGGTSWNLLTITPSIGSTLVDDITGTSSGVFYGVTNNNNLLEGSFCGQSFTTDLTIPAQTLCQGEDTTLTVVSSGTNLTYQWYKDGTAIAGATASTLSLTSVEAADDGQYYVEVYGDCDTTTSTTATIDVPAYTTDSLTTNVCVGDNPSLNWPLNGIYLNATYQWSKDGVPLSLQTSAFLSVNNATAADAGLYTRQTTVGSCVLESGNHLLNVGSAPTVTQFLPIFQPAICNGDIATLIATFNDGGLPTTYQWYEDNPNVPTTLPYALPGQTGDTLEISVFTNQAGLEYYREATNACGTASTTTTFNTVNTGPGLNNFGDAILFSCARATSFTLDPSPQGSYSYTWTLNGMALGGATSSTYVINNYSEADQGYV